mmetsp:Transcript_1903/g.3010  ORF Transcript_1903/g.3010 Transcript_1903/m.3010 type:complete len:246 (+) Transcript_1903:109-846(+)
MTSIQCRVGGTLFSTTVETLLAANDSYFNAALKNCWKKSENQCLEIDRDGTHFQYILDYLRYGNLPRDSAGRCKISQEVLEALIVEADYYLLPLLVKEIDQLLKFKSQGIKRYYINFFCLDHDRRAKVNLTEYGTYEAAIEVYEKHKADRIQPCDYVNNIYYSAEENSNSKDSDQNILVIEESDPVSGMVMKECFEDGCWWGPGGMQLLCIPIGTNNDKDIVMECSLRTCPNKITYDWNFNHNHS